MIIEEEYERVNQNKRAEQQRNLARETTKIFGLDDTVKTNSIMRASTALESNMHR
jgi:hypothetical protein